MLMFRRNILPPFSGPSHEDEGNKFFRKAGTEILQIHTPLQLSPKRTPSQPWELETSQNWIFPTTLMLTASTAFLFVMSWIILVLNIRTVWRSRIHTTPPYELISWKEHIKAEMWSYSNKQESRVRSDSYISAAGAEDRKEALSNKKQKHAASLL
jgi:hypothetical protein